jgi:hypothetical protein
MPMGASVKRVKSGGALVFAAGAVHALKGNSTLEFWRYSPGGGLVLSPAAAKTAVQGGSLQDSKKAFGLHPNPVADFARMSGGAPISGSVVLYDIGGRRVLRQTVDRAASVRLDVRALPAGIYLLELQTAEGRTTQKLVIER